MGSGKEKTVIFIGIAVLAIIIVAILFGTGVIDPGQKSSPETEAAPTPEASDKGKAGEAGTVSDPAEAVMTAVALGPGKYTCIIRDIDLDSCRIWLYDIDSGSDIEYTFTAATDIRTSYGKVISAALLKVGDIVVAETDDGARLRSLNGHGDFKTHKDVLRFTIDPAIDRLTAGNNVYKYDDRILVLDGERFISINDLNSLDVISLYYRDNTIFFIKVVSSHGFLSFVGTEDFDGGTITINGNSTSYQVSSNLSFPLAVGDYSVFVENLELSASADIRIDSHRTSVFDLSPFGRVPVTYGDVTFNINPEGALLYIDGINTFYGEPVSIPEGSHSIRVELGGYIAFVGTIEVSPSGGTFNISLPPAPIADNNPPEDILYNETDEGDSYIDRNEYPDAPDDDFIFDDNTSDSPEDSSPENVYHDDSEYDDSDTEDSAWEDSAWADSSSDDHSEGSGSSDLKMLISCTEGTSVYINGNLAATVSGGTAVCDKPRPGTVTVRLVLDGYISRTYTVTIEDDGEDAVFTFPDMVKQ
ncbi:MAG: PEGA domain-containing protein [Lachnospiraceae bacterium]|nr:PEGA domain-containing protein [Lachnospiraceae bacterium]